MTVRPFLFPPWDRRPDAYRVGAHRFDAMGPSIVYDSMRACSGSANARICRRIVDNRIVPAWPLGDVDFVVGRLISGPLGEEP